MNKWKYSINIGNWGAVLSIIIITVRAFSPNASPIELWSGFSWFFMLLPMLFPLYMFILYYCIYIIGLLCNTIINLIKIMRNNRINKK